MNLKKPQLIDCISTDKLQELLEGTSKEELFEMLRKRGITGLQGSTGGIKLGVTNGSEHGEGGTSIIGTVTEAAKEQVITDSGWMEQHYETQRDTMGTTATSIVAENPYHHLLDLAPTEQDTTEMWRPQTKGQTGTSVLARDHCATIVNYHSAAVSEGSVNQDGRKSGNKIGQKRMAETPCDEISGRTQSTGYISITTEMFKAPRIMTEAEWKKQVRFPLGGYVKLRLWPSVKILVNPKVELAVGGEVYNKVAEHIPTYNGYTKEEIWTGRAEGIQGGAKGMNVVKEALQGKRLDVTGSIRDVIMSKCQLGGLVELQTLTKHFCLDCMVCRSVKQGAYQA
jgi:hypothetical protein